MSTLTYLLFSDDGDLAAFGALGEGTGDPPSLLSLASDGGRLEIWRGAELVEVVGVARPAHGWGV